MTTVPMPVHDSAFLKACRREPVPHTPVWFMRQAGRALPEYRALREGTAMLESCFRPDMVTEITLQPVRRFGVDAAILFSDIVVPLKAIGLDLDIVAGVGPVVAEPFRTAADLDRLVPLEGAPEITQAVQQLVGELGATPLIGFAGAPFTLASYLVEGGPSKDQRRTKALMYGDPALWSQLMARLADITLAFLRVQVDAGASAVQLFDSWVGALPAADYREFVQPHSARILAGVADVPASTSASAPASCSTTWARPVPTSSASTSGCPSTRPYGGSVPARRSRATSTRRWCSPPTSVVRAMTERVLRQGKAAEGHVFNLGHGVLPETDPDVLTRIVDHVHEATGLWR